MQSHLHREIFRFGTFELEINARELRHQRLRVRLEEKPFRLLTMLVSRAGETVKRDELRRELWADDVHLDFEHGLNNAVSKVRFVLRDKAQDPRFIQTIPKVGYRFIAPVERGRVQTRDEGFSGQRCERRVSPFRNSLIKNFELTRRALGSGLGILAVSGLTVVALLLVGSGFQSRPPSSRDLESIAARPSREAYALGVYYQKFPADQMLSGSKRLLEQAIALNPDFAEAHAALALTDEFIGEDVSVTPETDFANAIKEAQRALTLNPSIADAHVAIGNMKLLTEWDWNGARLEYLRALDLDPNSARALEAYARFLGAAGRSAESLQAIERAQLLDPDSVRIQYDKAILNYLARHYKQAIAQLERLVQVEPEFPDARKSLSDAYARRGQWSKASIELLKWLAQIGVDGQEIRTTRRILQDHGFRELWQRNSRGNACHRSPDEYGMPFNRAVDSALLGDTEPAVNWLRRAYEQHDTRLLNLKVDPQFDKVRSDPRFSSLLQQIGFRL